MLLLTGWKEASGQRFRTYRYACLMPHGRAIAAESLRSLPPPPPAPASTNLDVTTMCALVSELSHGGAHDPHVEQWAQRTVHWVVGDGDGC